MITRRQLIAWATGALLTTSNSFAQPNKKSAVVGVLRHSDRESFIPFLDAFSQGLEALGYVEGKNLTLQARFSDGMSERLVALAQELARTRPDIIMAADTPSVRAVQQATTVIPIVIGTSTDPVGNGLVRSLARPGGNTTGLSNMSTDVSPKRLEMLAAVVPKLSLVAVLVNPRNPASVSEVRSLEKASKHSEPKLLTLKAATPAEIERAFETILKEHAEGVIVTSDSFFGQQLGQLASLALKTRVPLLFSSRSGPEAGLLMSYGPNNAANYRRAATYVDKILNGAKPGDLPIEQPTNIELVVNMRTAKALGLTIPQSMLMRADRVIE